MKIKVIEKVYDRSDRIEEVINLEMNDSLWNDVEGLWYEYNKRFDDGGSKVGVLDGWEVSKMEDVIVICSNGRCYEEVVFVKMG